MYVVCSMRVESMTILRWKAKPNVPGNHGSTMKCVYPTLENIVHRRGKVELMDVKL
jgi:hypothetical protein